LSSSQEIGLAELLVAISLATDLVRGSRRSGRASFTGHSVIHFIGGPHSFVVNCVANVNFRTDEPVVVVFEFVTCAGIGPERFPA
jgi:hypothetical protein